MIGKLLRMTGRTPGMTERVLGMTGRVSGMPGRGTGYAVKSAFYDGAGDREMMINGGSRKWMDVCFVR